MILWTEGYGSGVKKRFTRGLVAFFAGFAGWLALSVTLLVLSRGKNYTPFMIADIALSTAFGWFAVWYFTNPFRDQRNLLKLHGKMLSSLVYIERGKVVGEGNVTKDGVDLIKVTIMTADGERDIELFPEHAGTLREGGTYEFRTRANVAAECEAADE
ncbi:MAG: hypothetical protein J6U35_03150 [Clostridia bacterium]|nr:hypothetical protein [Clostridia bacterium]